MDDLINLINTEHSYFNKVIGDNVLTFEYIGFTRKPSYDYILYIHYKLNGIEKIATKQVIIPENRSKVDRIDYLIKSIEDCLMTSLHDIIFNQDNEFFRKLHAGVNEILLEQAGIGDKVY